jgi:hypothetical protein
VELSGDCEWRLLVRNSNEMAAYDISQIIATDYTDNTDRINSDRVIRVSWLFMLDEDALRFVRDIRIVDVHIDHQLA